MESADPEAASMRQEFAPTLESIGLARDFVVDVLAASAVQPPIDPSLAADVQLVVSELVTNAVTYGSGPTVVTLALTRSSVRCSVVSVLHDEAPNLLGAEVPLASARSGRGLMIVSALTDSVTADVEHSTWTVDCEFARR